MRRVISCIVVCLLAAGCTESGTEFQRSGVPALKLEVRRASIEKVEGWKPTTLKDPSGHTYYVSPEVELSNDDVASTRVHFEPFSGRSKGKGLWTWAAVFLVLSVVGLVQLRRRKQWQEGVLGVFFLLLGLGFLAWGFAAPVDEHAGFRYVVVKFNDAGKKKVDLVSAELAKGLSKKSYPKKYLAFLVDGEFTFRVPIWDPNTEGVYYLGNVGLSKEDATRIAKGIVGP